MKPYAKRMSRLGTETAFVVSAKADELKRQGKHIIRCEVGEPDFDSPIAAKEAAIEAIKQNETHYSPTNGRFELLEAIRDYVNENHGMHIENENVMIVPGGKPIMTFTFMSLVEPGDEVIIPNPGYPIYESMVNFMGGTPVFYELREENDFVVDTEELEKLITPRTKLFVMNTPHNPCGSVMDLETTQRIADLAQKHDFWVLSDEIYWRILYEGTHTPIISLPGMLERTVMLDGFSKYYAMTGWRLGFGIMNKEMRQHMNFLMTNVSSNVTTFVQLGGVAALKGSQDETDRMVAKFKSRRDLMYEGLNNIEGVTANKPHGAFYILANISSFGMKAAEFADKLLYDGGVATTAATYFGSAGEGYIRFSYANSEENLQEAIRRLDAFTKTLK